MKYDLKQNSNDVIKTVFEVTGFTNIFPIR